MGLDMYLYADKYLGHWDHMKNGGRGKEYKQAEQVFDIIGLPGLKDVSGSNVTVSACVGYWRKANAIHAWFVENVQGGVDECQKSYVDRAQLSTLRDACTAILATVEYGDTETVTPMLGAPYEHFTVKSLDTDLAGELLPPQEGFFFGSTEMDEWYVRDLKDTVEILDKVLPLDGTYDFYYQSSW